MTTSPELASAKLQTDSESMKIGGSRDENSTQKQTFEAGYPPHSWRGAEVESSPFAAKHQDPQLRHEQENSEECSQVPEPDFIYHESLSTEVDILTQKVAGLNSEIDSRPKRSGGETTIPTKTANNQTGIRNKNKKTQPLMGLEPSGCNPDIVRSGHPEYDTLWASNDVQTDPPTINVLNAPNSSTIECGCENINCPFCNLMLSIENNDSIGLK